MSYYTTPQYSKRELNRAGDTLMNPNATQDEKDAALGVINNWRSAHSFPLNTFQKRLRNLTKSINDKSLVVQRVKRLPSIILKLERFPNMNIAQIQDFGGCRAIMNNVVEVDALVDIYKHKSRGVKHKLHKEDDYIANPKISGYRGVHLVYKYKSDKDDSYDDMRIEIQIRTLLQHAWATCVEIVGAFVKQSLKSSQGEEDWLRFFALMSSAMALTEGKPTVPGTPDDIASLRLEISELSNKLDVEGHLTAFKTSMSVVSSGKIPNAYYYLIELDTASRKLTIKPYSQTQWATASSDYERLEKRMSNDTQDAVLVSADSIDTLRLAYPNYYLDSDTFLAELHKITFGSSQLTLF